MRRDYDVLRERVVLVDDTGRVLNTVVVPEGWEPPEGVRVARPTASVSPGDRVDGQGAVEASGERLKAAEDVREAYGRAAALLALLAAVGMEREGPLKAALLALLEWSPQVAEARRVVAANVADGAIP